MIDTDAALPASHPAGVAPGTPVAWMDGPHVRRTGMVVARADRCPADRVTLRCTDGHLYHVQPARLMQLARDPDRYGVGRGDVVTGTCVGSLGGSAGTPGRRYTGVVAWVIPPLPGQRRRHHRYQLVLTGEEHFGVPVEPVVDQPEVIRRGEEPAPAADIPDPRALYSGRRPNNTQAKALNRLAAADPQVGDNLAGAASMTRKTLRAEGWATMVGRRYHITTAGLAALYGIRRVGPSADTPARLATGRLSAFERRAAVRMFGTERLTHDQAVALIAAELGGPPACGMDHGALVAVCRPCGWRRPPDPDHQRAVATALLLS